MPRNGSGTYTLPVGPFTPGTVISSSDVNSDFSDIATALTASLAADGQTQITGQLKSSAGASPSYTFAGDTNTGFGSSGPDVAYVMVGGSTVINVTTTTIATSGVFTNTGDFIVTGTFTSGGVATLNNGLSITFGGATIAGILTLSSTSHELIPNGTTGQRPGSPAAAQFRFNSTLSWIEFYSGTAWVQPGRAFTTKTYVTASGTYTTPTGCRAIFVQMIAGGGGGGGGSANNGSNGTLSQFDAIITNPGAGGINSGNVGGLGGSGGAGAVSLRVAGTPGGYGGASNSGGTAAFAGCGAPGIEGQGGGRGGLGGGGGSAGTAAIANSGAGGGGGGGAGLTAGSGGGAGEYVEFSITSPAATYAVTIGAGGAGGAAGGNAGGAGGSGVVIVWEFY